MTRARQASSFVAAAALLCHPATQAWALCPNCLGQSRSLTPTLEVLGAFLLVPFLVALVVLRVIRRAIR